MSGSMLLPKPEQLIDLVGHAVVIKQAMSGEFDKEIAAFKEARAALQEATSIAATLKEAEKIRDDAKAYAEKISARCDEALTKAEQKLGVATQAEAVLTSREGAVARREAAADFRAKGLDSRERSMATAFDTRDAALNERALQLKKNEENHAAAAAKLATDIAAFNARLESLRA